MRVNAIGFQLSAFSSSLSPELRPPPRPLRDEDARMDTTEPRYDGSDAMDDALLTGGDDLSMNEPEYGDSFGEGFGAGFGAGKFHPMGPGGANCKVVHTGFFNAFVDDFDDDDLQ